MLEVKNVSKTFNPGTVNEKTALNGVSLHLNEGDFVTVIGGNGAGKSTLLNAVAGLWPVDRGTISVGGLDVTRLPEYKRAKYIGRVFQDPMMGTAATMQIEENLALAARRGQRRSLRSGITKEEREGYRETLKLQGGTSLRGTAAGPDPFDGYPSEATASSAGRAYRRAGPQDGGQGAGRNRAHRGEGPPHHSDDHPQYEGRHRPWQPAYYDVRREDRSGYCRGGQEKADSGAASGPVWSGYRVG